MLKIKNQYIVPSGEQTKWDLTPDGFLRCQARILSEGIMPYGRNELGEIPDICKGDPINLFVPMEEMKSSHAIRSLEGAPVVVGEHTWLTPENIKEFGVGNVAGTPRIDGPWLVCDLLITDSIAIQKIQAKEYSENSAAYTADTLFEEGKSYEGNPYDAKQVGLRYNHIAVIPEGEGRGGRDVKILNKDLLEKGNKKMEVVKVTLKNTNQFINTDEEGAKILNVFLNQEEKKVKGDMEGLLNQLEEKNASSASLLEEIESLKGELAVYKEKLDSAMSPETIQTAAENMIEEKSHADEIVQNTYEGEDDKKEEIKNSLKKLHGEALHKEVLGHCGVKIENMSPAELRGAFSAQYQISSKHPRTKVAGTKLTNSVFPEGPVKGSQIPNRTGHERLGFKNSKK